jgi:hypothetical protein
MTPLTWINRQAVAARCMLKVLGAVLLTIVVLFPRLDRVPTWIARHRDPEALVQPAAPELRPLIDEFDTLRRAEWDSARELNEVKTFVYRKLPYEWDWNLWGNADYFPTVAEALARGREDCDGRAVVAASLLRHYGYDAHLAGDITHIWVETEKGATMDPNPVTGMRMTAEGRQINWAVLKTLPSAVGFGVAVFPLGRELILAAGLWLLLLRLRVPARRLVLWLAVIIIGLLVIREGGHASAAHCSLPSKVPWVAMLKQWGGLAIIAAAVTGMIVQQRRAE